MFIELIKTLETANDTQENNIVNSSMTQPQVVEQKQSKQCSKLTNFRNRCKQILKSIDDSVLFNIGYGITETYLVTAIALLVSSHYFQLSVMFTITALKALNLFGFIGLTLCFVGTINSMLFVKNQKE